MDGMFTPESHFIMMSAEYASSISSVSSLISSSIALEKKTPHKVMNTSIRPDSQIIIL